MQTIQKQRIIVKDIIGTNNISFVSRLSIDNLLDLMIKYIQEEEEIIVDFEGIDNLNSFFINATIGTLYKYFSLYAIENQIKVIGLSEDKNMLMDKVLKASRDFFYKYE